MGQWKILGTSALVAALLSGTAAQADLTAEQVWQSWVDYYASLGQTITEGSKGMEGDTLVVTDATFGSTMPDGSFTATLPELRLKELGDGRVEVTFAPEMPITGTGKSPEGETTELAMKLVQTGMTMIVSGAPEDMTYDFTADEMAVTLDNVSTNGTPVPVTVDVSMKGNTGTYHMTKSGGTTVTSDFKADSVAFNFAGTDPEKPESSFAASGTINGVSGTSDMTIPEGVDLAQMHTALAAGLNIKGDATFGGGGYTFDVKDPEQSMNGSVNGGGGAFNFAMSSEGLAYGASGKDAQVSVTGSAIPFPVEVSYGESAFNFVLPVSKGDTAQPFAMLLKVVDLKVSDSLWGMFDPTSQLPRDPATVILDVSGMAKMLVDIMDPANQNSDAMPGELEEVSLNELKLSVAGAELTGSGAATVDNSTGVPKPVGAVDLQLSGANALIDKLVAMGLIPEDQAMGARMMMGMFAVAAGDDVLTSKIEFKEDGGIYANGQRIQ